MTYSALVASIVKTYEARVLHKVLDYTCKTLPILTLINQLTTSR